MLWERVEGSKASSSAKIGSENTKSVVRGLDDDDAAEGRPAANAPKGAVSDLTRSTDEPPSKRQRGQNKGRTFARIYEEGQRLCHSTNRGEPCARLASGLSCDLNHDIKAYLASQKKDVILATESDPDIIKNCPVGRICIINYFIKLGQTAEIDLATLAICHIRRLSIWLQMSLFDESRHSNRRRNGFPRQWVFSHPRFGEASRISSVRLANG